MILFFFFNEFPLCISFSIYIITNRLSFSICQTSVQKEKKKTIHILSMSFKGSIPVEGKQKYWKKKKKREERSKSFNGKEENKKTLVFPFKNDKKETHILNIIFILLYENMCISNIM